MRSPAAIGCPDRELLNGRARARWVARDVASPESGAQQASRSTSLKAKPLDDRSHLCSTSIRILEGGGCAREQAAATAARKYMAGPAPPSRHGPLPLARLNAAPMVSLPVARCQCARGALLRGMGRVTASRRSSGKGKALGIPLAACQRIAHPSARAPQPARCCGKTALAPHAGAAPAGRRQLAASACVDKMGSRGEQSVPLQSHKPGSRSVATLE